jgi:hypothetical protein
MFATLAAADAISDRPDDIVAAEVTRHGQRIRISRLPGETVEALHNRANPSGSWKARPLPIYARGRLRV